LTSLPPSPYPNEKKELINHDIINSIQSNLQTPSRIPSTPSQTENLQKLK